MKTLTPDVAVIGGGSAGLAAFRAAKEHTGNVLLIESGPWGTTCARVGCMPSKLLIAAAENAHQLEKSEAFGIRLPGKATIDGGAVMDRVKRERDRFVGFVLEGVQGIPEQQRIEGRARFLDANTVQVGDHTRIEAKRFVIATGSSPAIPPQLKAAGDRLIINDDVFDWDDLPGSVAVFGPGVIGLELGQALHRLGVRVLMFGVGGGVGPLSDPQVRNYAAKTFADEFYLDPDARVEHIEQQGMQVLLRYRDRRCEAQETRVDYVLAATGRRPNLQGLDLDKAGVILDERGQPSVDPHTMQVDNLPLFIAGDANNLLPLLHEAADQGKIAGDNAGRFPDVQPGLRRTPLSVVFTDPQLAMAGLTYRELVSQYGECGCFAAGEVSFENQGRSRVMLRNKGLLRVYGEQGTGRLLGAEMMGPDAEHLGHLLAWVIQQGLTVKEVLDLPFYHPVVEEGLRTALRDLNAQLKLGPEVLQNCLETCVGS